ncbi:hypothetical protein M8494_32880 [Serratia ureilytica]
MAAIDDARDAANALSRRVSDAQRPQLQPLLAALDDYKTASRPTCRPMSTNSKSAGGSANARRRSACW